MTSRTEITDSEKSLLVNEGGACTRTNMVKVPNTTRNLPH
jgi:hypothetical protein